MRHKQEQGHSAEDQQTVKERLGLTNKTLSEMVWDAEERLLADNPAMAACQSLPGGYPFFSELAGTGEYPGMSIGVDIYQTEIEGA